MKQRKDSEKTSPVPKKPESKKTIQELTEQINHIIGKDPKKATRIVEAWVKDQSKNNKKVA